METTSLKSTALSDIHIDLGAKMIEFAGYNMPVLYTNLNEEHLAVRNSVGVFDVSHMGEFLLKGEKALDLIQYVTTNDASTLFPGRVQYSCLPNGKGGIVDDLLVYMIDHNEYLLVVNASNMEKDWNWISQHNTFGVEMENISDHLTLLAVQGPNAKAALQKLTDVDLDDIPYYHFTRGRFAGVDNVIISNTGYTGSGGFEIYAYNAFAEDIWKAVFKAGEEFDIKPIGLGARDTLRLEKGFCLYGNDIDDTTSPLEAGLGWITKLDKEDFIDIDFLTKQKAEGTKRRLVGFEIIDKGPVGRQGHDVLDAGGNKIGVVTSGTLGPSIGKRVGMAYINKPHTKSGTEVYVQVRNKVMKAVVTKVPFV